MNQAIKKKSNLFIKQYGIIKTLDDIKSIIESQGYSVVEYNSVSNIEDVQIIIDELNIQKYIIQSKAFTYVSDKYRIVFVNESLNDNEKMIVLTHEEGHIYCEHFGHSNIIGLDVIEENEANEFSHYILNPTVKQSVMQSVKKHKKIVIVIISILTIISIIGAAFAINNNNAKYCDNYYITTTGQKYHREDCIFVKDKTNINKLTKEQYESGEYEPCAMCLPDKE